MKLIPIFTLVISLSVSSLAYAQKVYKPTFSALRKYEGTYEYSGNTTLQIAASPVDTLLYALIGTSGYKLRPSSNDIFLNGGNQEVHFLRSNGRITGFREGSDPKAHNYARLSSKTNFSPKMWYARENGGKKFSYQYHVPVQRKDGLHTGSLLNSGLDTALIHTLVDRIVDGTYPGVHSVLIIKDGKLVLEEYFYEHQEKKLHELRSASKSFTSALVGIASGKGLLDLDHPVLSYLPEFSPENPDPRKSRITVKNLLTQQSGFACYDYDGKSPGNEVKMYPTANWIKFMLDLPMQGNPGEAASYCSGNVMLLNQIVSNVSHQSISEFARKNLFDKLGIKNYKWEFVPDSTHENDFGQVHLASRDMAKFGLLYLQGGAWNGEQVIPREFVTASLSKQSNVDGINYGYLWWCEDLTANGKVFKGMAAKGNGGQRIFIWPGENMVAVVTGGNYNTQSPANKLLIECVLSGLKKK